MESLAPDNAGSRVSSSSSDDLSSTDAAKSFLANDGETCVGAERSSSEDANPNPLELIGDPPTVPSDTHREVAALKAQVGELAVMLRALMAQRTLATPPSLPVCGLCFSGSVECPTVQIERLSLFL